MMKQLFVLAACVAVAASTVIDCMSCRLDSIQVDTFVTGTTMMAIDGCMHFTPSCPAGSNLLVNDVPLEGSQLTLVCQQAKWKFTSPTHGAIEITKLGCQQSGSQSGQGPQ